MREAVARAWRAHAEVARRVRVDGVLPAAEPTSEDALRAFADEARPRLERQLAEIAAQLGKAAATRAPSVDDEPWRRLEEAIRKVEADLRSAATWRSRLDEGRRSLLPKVERAVRERLDPRVTVRGARIEARLDPAGLDALRGELPQWVDAWAAYAYAWLERDLQRELEIAWSPKEGDLPIAPPTFAPLQPPATSGELSFPDVTVGRDLPGLASGLARHTRSVTYGLLSLTFLFGIGRSEIPKWVYALGILAAVAYGGTLVQEERRQVRERAEADLRARADQATWEAVRLWLDRGADRLTEGVRTALHARRQELVAWYRREVVPRKEALARSREQEARAADRLRAQLPVLQESQRGLERALDSLQGVTRALDAQPGA